MRQDGPDRPRAGAASGLRSPRAAVRAGSSGPARPRAAGGRPDWVGRGLRVSGAVLILVSGAVHLDGWLGEYSGLPVIGPLFLLNACSSLVISVAVAFAGGLSARLRLWLIEPLALLAGWGFAALTLAAFLVSVVHGLFGFQESLQGTPQDIAGIAEILTMIVLGWALARWLWRLRR